MKKLKFYEEQPSILWAVPWSLMGKYDWFMLSRKVSAVLRETMVNAGLVLKEKVEKENLKGEKKIVDKIIYPRVEVKMDEYNFYLWFRMISGQTRKMWESKIDAFSQSLGGDLVGSKMRHGVVEIVVQHSLMDVTQVLRKNDDEHYLYIGYKAGGVLKWDFDSYPHMLLVGVTGAGKSTFLRMILTQIPRDWTLRIVDGKQVEFTYMKDFGYDVVDSKEGFLRYVDDAIDEMENRYRYMTSQRKNHYKDCGLKPYFLVLDEWISLVENLEKKGVKGEKAEREIFFEKMKTLTTKGRAAGVFVIGILQRPDTEFMSGVVRDMFTCKVVLKGLSVAFKMAFDEDGKGLEILDKGQGYCMIDDISVFSFPNYELDEFIEDLERRGIPHVVEGTNGEPVVDDNFVRT
ncbi:DUF815 domain-containing protein [Thermoactinomyces daqus]|uniref:DUF815 domain-containing protein n=1 Tax=Thermoactinomyces daqus TaxID=1329516 RepID=A0A7W1XDK4_9BACL|nr:FtsK/SpoIIIE domain-containing protein [Thermoactinomyces daqus]MBA4544690.1 DUF815 domain-containing protein [Thermoactinomyces daqus]